MKADNFGLAIIDALGLSGITDKWKYTYISEDTFKILYFDYMKLYIVSNKKAWIDISS